MNEPDIGKVERHLAAALEKERRDAIAYTILTVLCTPAFVGLVISPKGLDFVRTATQSPSHAQPQSGGAQHDRT